MIIYEKTKAHFISDVDKGVIVQAIVDGFDRNGIHWGGPNEKRSWLPSLRSVRDVLLKSTVPGDVDVGIEYRFPLGGERIDFLLFGADETGKENIVILELKQWSEVSVFDPRDDILVSSDLKGGAVPSKHPCYQAYVYRNNLMDYAPEVSQKGVGVHPMAYCMNLTEQYRSTLTNDPYAKWPQKARLFLCGDEELLAQEIDKYITRKTNGDQPLYELDQGMPVPSKSLQKMLSDILKGNAAFDLKGNQEDIAHLVDLQIATALATHEKKTILITGGPGTGKSVLAINLLVEWHRKGYFSIYYTKNGTPRKCYQKLLAKGDAELLASFNGMFPTQNGIAAFATNENSVKVGLFDEAHRLQKRPFQYRRANMLRDAISESLVSVFFLDEDQRVTCNDIGSAELIRKTAEELGSQIIEGEWYHLSTQFRCHGSEGYAAFIDNLLGIRPTDNPYPPRDFEFKVFKTPQELKEALREKNQGKQTARMVAGYCYPWNLDHPERGLDYDFLIATPQGDFKAVWNLPGKSDIWAVRPESFDEIGCIHTCQGMEFDYVGVLIGRDLSFANGQVVTHQEKISTDDNTSKIRTCKDKALADRLIRNTYRVLMTRGLSGCYVYCEDEALRAHLEELVAKGEK